MRITCKINGSINQRLSLTQKYEKHENKPKSLLKRFNLNNLINAQALEFPAG